MIGHLRHRVAIEAVAITEDEGGGVSEVWQAVATVWARIEAVSGREVVRAGQLGPKVLYRITIRHRSDVDAGQRLALDGVRLEIDAAYDPDGRRERLVLDAYLQGTGP